MLSPAFYLIRYQMPLFSLEVVSFFAAMIFFQETAARDKNKTNWESAFCVFNSFSDPSSRLAIVLCHTLGDLDCIPVNPLSPFTIEIFLPHFLARKTPPNRFIIERNVQTCFWKYIEERQAPYLLSFRHSLHCVFVVVWYQSDKKWCMTGTGGSDSYLYLHFMQLPRGDLAPKKS